MHPPLAVLVSAVTAVLAVTPVTSVATSRRAMRHQPEEQPSAMQTVFTPNQTLLQMHFTTGKDIGGCFERIAIGRRLADVTVSTPLAMLPECEMKCFLSPDCRAFSFGMGRHGNGTCEMQHGTAAERLARRRGRRPRRLEPTQQPEDPDYDLFERRADCETPAATQQPPDEDERAPPPLLLQELAPQSGGEPDREEPMMTCFRRLFSGRRLAERHIRRSLPAQGALECEAACTRERQFVCEGFNFRADRQRLGRGSCELSARPHGELGPALLRDFIEDREYDFFERRRGGPPECSPSPGGGNLHPGDYRPSSSHHAGVSGGHPGNWNSGGPPNRYGANQQGPNQHHGPHQRPHGPNPSYGPHQQEPQYRPHQQGHQGPPPYGGPQQGPHHGPNQQRPQYGPHQQGPQYGPHQQGHQGPPPYGGPQQGPHHGPNQQGPHHGPNQQGPQYGPHHGPNQQGPQYGPHQQGSRPGSSPVGAPWSPGSVGFYGPPGAGHGEHGAHGGPGHGGPPGGYGPQGGGPPGGFGGPGGGGHPSHKDDDECFARVWSGQRLDDSAIRASASHPSLGGCQLECLHAREFVCRAFSYRHGPPHAGDSCLLTDRPVAELHPRVGLVADPEFEFYERSSFGNGCEHIAHFPSSLPWSQGNFHEESNQLPPLLAQPMPGRNPGHHHQSGEHECYAEYWPSARLSATAVSVATHAPSMSDCLSRCTGAEQQWQTPCRSLAYRGGVHGHNCLLSELAQRDLRPDMDFVHDGEGSAEESWRLMAWDWSDARCREPPPGARPPGGGYQGGPQGGPPGGPHGPPHGGNNLQPWDGPNRDKGVVGGAGGAGNSWGSGGSGGGGGGGSSWGAGGSGGGGGSSWGAGGGGGGGGNSWGAGGGGGGSPLSFTVSGKPCARGHTCQLNPQAGFWSCPMSEGSGKEWDYCCSPSHHCGYSEGMQIPWCYVGQSKDQWRPCSERYWPYSGNNKNIDREGRFLPVAFLHRSGPPGHEYRGNGTSFQSTNSLRSLRMLPHNTTESTVNSSRRGEASDLKPISLTVVTSKVK